MDWNVQRWKTGFSARLPFPPTANTYYRAVNLPRKNHPVILISARGRAYAEIVAGTFGIFTPLNGALKVAVSAWFPNLRVRDVDNLLKPLLDALTKARAWGDDSQIQILAIEAAGMDRPDGRVEVVAQQIEAMLF